MLAKEEKLLRLCMGLMGEKPWLDRKRADALVDLFTLCDSEQQETLLVELTRRLLYLDEKAFNAALSSIANDLCALPNELRDGIIISAISMSRDTDSSQIVAYSFKHALANLKWFDPRIYGHLAGALKQVDENTHTLVLVDEFVGTGATVVNKVEHIRRTCNERGKKPPKILVRVIAGMELGLQRIADHVDEIRCEHSLTRGITDNFGDEAAELISAMKLIEEKLATDAHGQQLPSLGYGEAEALFARENGNTPNSVFPVYWWPLLRDGSLRNTMFVRGVT